MTILLVGASGALATTVSARLAELDELAGIDLRPLPDGRSFPGAFRRLPYTHRKLAEVFREHRPRVLVHMGRIRPSRNPSAGYRFQQNVLGTRNLLELSGQYGVERVVVLSTFNVYGAHYRNPTGIREDAVLRASHLLPQLSDAVELDHAATSNLWRCPQVETVVLRPANVVGPTLNNMISRLLRRPRVMRLLGYDPMLQFVHEEDVAQAVQLAVRSDRRGIYNVAGEGTVSFTRAIELCGARPVSLPHPVAYALARGFSRRRAAARVLLDFVRYPTVIDDRLIRRELGYAPRYTTRETLLSVRAAP